MKILVEVEVDPGEHPIEALRRELQAIVVRDYPLRIPLPGDGKFEVVIPALAHMAAPPALTLDTMGEADGALSFEVRRVK